MTHLFFYSKLAIAVAASISIGRLAPQQSVQALEGSLAGSVGAIVGGVIAALAFAFVVLAQLFKNLTDNDQDFSSRYKAVTKGLLTDVVLLIWCLAGAIVLPVIRHIDIPFISMPHEISTYLTKGQAITSLELFIVFASISILFEVSHSMFQTFIADSLTQKKA